MSNNIYGEFQTIPTYSMDSFTTILESNQDRYLTVEQYDFLLNFVIMNPDILNYRFVSALIAHYKTRIDHPVLTKVMSTVFLRLNNTKLDYKPEFEPLLQYCITNLSNVSQSIFLMDFFEMLTHLLYLCQDVNFEALNYLNYLGQVIVDCLQTTNFAASLDKLNKVMCLVVSLSSYCGNSLRWLQGCTCTSRGSDLSSSTEARFTKTDRPFILLISSAITELHLRLPELYQNPTVNQEELSDIINSCFEVVILVILELSADEESTYELDGVIIGFLSDEAISLTFLKLLDFDVFLCEFLSHKTLDSPINVNNLETDREIIQANVESRPSILVLKGMAIHLLWSRFYYQNLLDSCEETTGVFLCESAIRSDESERYWNIDSKFKIQNFLPIQKQLQSILLWSWSDLCYTAPEQNVVTLCKPRDRASLWWRLALFCSSSVIALAKIFPSSVAQFFSNMFMCSTHIPNDFWPKLSSLTLTDSHNCSVIERNRQSLCQFHVYIAQMDLIYTVHTAYESIPQDSEDLSETCLLHLGSIYLQLISAEDLPLPFSYLSSEANDFICCKHCLISYKEMLMSYMIIFRLLVSHLWQAELSISLILSISPSIEDFSSNEPENLLRKANEKLSNALACVLYLARNIVCSPKSISYFGEHQTFASASSLKESIDHTMEVVRYVCGENENFNSSWISTCSQFAELNLDFPYLTTC